MNPKAPAGVRASQSAVVSFMKSRGVRSSSAMSKSTVGGASAALYQTLPFRTYASIRPQVRARARDEQRVRSGRAARRARHGVAWASEISFRRGVGATGRAVLRDTGRARPREAGRRSGRRDASGTAGDPRARAACARTAAAHAPGAARARGVDGSDGRPGQCRCLPRDRPVARARRGATRCARICGDGRRDRAGSTNAALAIAAAAVAPAGSAPGAQPVERPRQHSRQRESGRHAAANGGGEAQPSAIERTVVARATEARAGAAGAGRGGREREPLGVGKLAHEPDAAHARRRGGGPRPRRRRDRLAAPPRAPRRPVPEGCRRAPRARLGGRDRPPCCERRARRARTRRRA